MSIVQKMFLDHPASVEETYLEHMATASSFGARMILAGLACLIHGLLPCCFSHLASDQIRQLHRRMDDRRPAGPAASVRETAVGIH